LRLLVHRLYNYHMGSLLKERTVAPKDRTVTFRISSAEDERIRAAAEACRESLTDFTLRSALNRADEVLGKADIVFVPPEQFEVMMAALAEPVTPIPKLVKLAAEPRKFVRA